MPNKKQKVKIFRRKYGKHPKTGKHCMLEDLEQGINNFLKENPDLAKEIETKNEKIFLKIFIFPPENYT